MQGKLGSFQRVAVVVLPVLVAAVLLCRMSHQTGENLEPRVDALEYAAVATRLAAGEPPMLPIGARTYPSRYPVGFPLLLAPPAWAGVPPERLYWVSAVLALVGIGATAVAAMRLASCGPASWAALLLATSPLYLRHGVMVMSDGPTAALAAMWAAVLLHTGPSLGLGLLAGVSCSIRLMNLPLLLAGGVVALMAGDGRARLRFVAGTVVGLLPIAVSVAAGWSGPLGGYAFWMPEFYDPPTAAFGREWLHANLAAYVPVLLGVQWRPSLYPFLVVPLAALGAYAAVDRRRVGVVLGTAVVYAGLCVCYFFRAERLLLPVVPLVLIVAAGGLAVVARRSRLLAGAIVVVSLGIQLGAALRSTRPAPPRASSAATLTAVAAHLASPALVVSDVPAVLAWLYWVRGTQREFLPLVVPPRGRKRSFDDRHLRRLDANAGDPRWPGTVPDTFVDATGVSPAGLDAVRRHATGTSPALVVTCTAYGRRAAAVAMAQVSLTPVATEGPCAVWTLAAR